MTKMWICYTSSCFIMVSAFITLTVLGFVALEPRLYVQELYVPALVNSTRYNSTSFNTSIYMDLKFKRVSTFIALSYVDLNITLFYNSNRSSSAGYYVFPGFVQGHKKTVHRKMVVVGSGVPWEDAVQKISGRSTVVFTVALATKYRVERCTDDDCSYTQATTMVVDAEVEVDGSGHKVSKKAIRFR